MNPEVPSEQRLSWSFDQEGIVDSEEIVESSSTSTGLPTFIHKLTPLNKGTVTATATPWDTTGGAKPIKLKIHVLGNMSIKPNRELNKDNNVDIKDGALTYTKEVSTKATYYISNSILSRLLNVKVDGNVIDASKYETMEGSIILSLKKDYLDTLSPGTHKLEVETKDGKVETNFEIKAAPELKKYKATYEFKSITEGKELPAEIAANLLPAPLENIADKTELTAGELTKTSFEVQGGKWVFKGWSPKSVTINGADVHFVGSWEFTAETPKPASADYYFETGANLVWKNGDKDLKFVVKSKTDDSKTFEHFKGIEIDGRKLDAANYDVSHGSVKISLHSSYLKTLSQGKHTLTLNFDNGSVSTSFTVGASGTVNTGTVNTGDDSGIGYMLMLLIVASILVTALRSKRTVK